MKKKIVDTIKEFFNRKKLWVRLLITLGFVGLIIFILVPKSCETKKIKYKQDNINIKGQQQQFPEVE